MSLTLHSIRRHPTAADVEALRWWVNGWGQLLRTAERHRWSCDLDALPAYAAQLAMVRAEYDAAVAALAEAEGR